MRGTKRSAISEFTPIFNSNDSFMQSKRVIMGSQFDAQRAEPSLQQPQRQSQPPLDMQRAESSRQHVRALNTQFASWIQAQLQSHPDELWGDGVQDYLNHAKSIVEKFSDVVNWLKTNAAKGESSHQLPNDAQMKQTLEIDKTNHKLVLERPGFSTAATTSFGESSHQLLANDTQMKPTLESDKNNRILALEKPGFPPAATAKFGTSWSPGIFFNSNTPFTFGGNQVSVPSNANSVPSIHEVSNETDGDDVEQPSSPSVRKSEEKGIHVVHEVKCKLYVKSIDPSDKDAWKDKGMGQLSIKCKEGVNKGTKESKPTIVIRNDIGKVLLNALLYPGIKTNMQKNSVVAIFHTSADGENTDTVVARTFLMRTKTEEDRDKLAAAIQEYAPAA